jgi:hypothetical protein
MALMFDNLCFIVNVNVVVKLFNCPVPYSMTLNSIMFGAEIFMGCFVTKSGDHHNRLICSSCILGQLRNCINLFM